MILDIRLPGLSGLEVSRRVRDRYSGWILMLTGKIVRKDLAVCFEAGTDDYVSKPVENDIILVWVEALFGHEDRIGRGKS